MSEVGQKERKTQNRVVQEVFREQLEYRYLGNWQDREHNSNIEEALLRTYLKEKQGYSDTSINEAFYEPGLTLN